MVITAAEREEALAEMAWLESAMMAHTHTHARLRGVGVARARVPVGRARRGAARRRNHLLPGRPPARLHEVRARVLRPRLPPAAGDDAVARSIRVSRCKAGARGGRAAAARTYGAGHRVVLRRLWRQAAGGVNHATTAGRRAFGHVGAVRPGAAPPALLPGAAPTHQPLRALPCRS